MSNHHLKFKKEYAYDRATGKFNRGPLQKNIFHTTMDQAHESPISKPLYLGLGSVQPKSIIFY